MAKIIGNTVGIPNPQSDWNQNDPSKADYIKNKDLVEKEIKNNTDNISKIVEGETQVGFALTADHAYSAVSASQDDELNIITITYARKIYIGNEHEFEDYDPVYSQHIDYDFSLWNNSEMRVSEENVGEPIGFVITDDVYPEDYTSGLVFDTGETPPMLVYTENSRILHWVGTDCAITDGLSIFAPQPNTHYDIVFYFNGTCFVGLVNGYKLATSNQ